jgi:hypothetical protein
MELAYFVPTESHINKKVHQLDIGRTLMNHLSDDNPRSKGFKTLVVGHYGVPDRSRSTTFLAVHYFSPQGFWEKRDDFSVHLYSDLTTGNRINAREENRAQALFREFANSHSWLVKAKRIPRLCDKVVIALGPEGDEFARQLSNVTQIPLKKLDNTKFALDSLTDYSSGTRQTMLQHYPTHEDLMRAYTKRGNARFVFR